MKRLLAAAAALALFAPAAVAQPKPSPGLGAATVVINVHNLKGSPVIVQTAGGACLTPLGASPVQPGAWGKFQIAVADPACTAASTNLYLSGPVKAGAALSITKVDIRNVLALQARAQPGLTFEASQVAMPNQPGEVYITVQ